MGGGEREIENSEMNNEIDKYPIWVWQPFSADDAPFPTAKQKKNPNHIESSGNI